MRPGKGHRAEWRTTDRNLADPDVAGNVTALARAGSWFDVPPGQIVVSQDEGTSVYVVATGQLEALVDGRRASILRTGDFPSARDTRLE
jgi:hypothetical protein